MTWVRAAFVLAIVACLLPALSVLTAGLIASSHGCTLHEGFVNPCIVLGRDIGKELYALAVLGWLLIATLPVLMMLVSGWILVELAVWWVRRRAHTEANLPEKPPRPTS